MSEQIRKEFSSHEDYLVYQFEREEAIIFKPEVIVEFKDEERFNLPEGVSPIKNKGGDKMKKTKSSKKRVSKRRKLTPEERNFCKKLIKNKGYYLDKEINGKGIWGIGPNAITLYDEVFPAHEHHAHMRTHAGKQYFHNYFKKINKPNSFDDGVELAYKIVDKYGKLGNWDD